MADVAPDIDALFAGLRAGSRLALARALTLVESTRPDHERAAAALLDRCLPLCAGAPRIGVTGVPGAGKSTFIDALGMQLLEQGRRVGVCAIDPSSKQTHGSILGDKTRMTRLAADERAFIRPTPNAGAYGGVASRTREALVLLEAAGFDFLFVETVGVGQSETSVTDLVDMVLVLTLTGAGDALQGMKRGVLEIADALIIHKADGDNRVPAQVLRKEMQHALHLFQSPRPEWEPAVLTASSQTGEGLDALRSLIDAFLASQQADGHLAALRARQTRCWLHERIAEGVQRQWKERAGVEERLGALEADVQAARRSAPSAALEILDLVASGRLI
ncbi:MAG: methylmalonyl Co-A mutase-associated GTPase MeaB [Rhodothermales bacterium]